MNAAELLCCCPAVERLVRACVAANRTLAVAESLTGGLLAAAIVGVPDSGVVFLGGIVAYHPDTKSRLLGVEGPVVTASAAEQMATGALDRFGSDLALSTTGVAGPAEEEGVAVGTVFLGFARRGAASYSSRLQLHGRPEEVRLEVMRAAAELGRRGLNADLTAPWPTGLGD